MQISAQSIKTSVFRKGDSLNTFLENHLASCSLEGKILALTSKIASLAEGRMVSLKGVTKKELIAREADSFLCEGQHGVELTIKHGILIPSAGIDESNSESGDYILYPHDPYQIAQSVCKFLKQKFNLKNFGIILTDSHSAPLRKGVTGIALAHWGFEATASLVGKPDIFNKPLKFTHVNVADSLAALAVLVMGEANECTPLALVSAENIEFTESSSQTDIQIEPENDLYYPLLAPYLKK
jgi:F420-0:gamma-glutamyl ligase